MGILRSKDLRSQDDTNPPYVPTRNRARLDLLKTLTVRKKTSPPIRIEGEMRYLKDFRKDLCSHLFQVF